MFGYGVYWVDMRNAMIMRVRIALWAWRMMVNLREVTGPGLDGVGYVAVDFLYQGFIWGRLRMIGSVVFRVVVIFLYDIVSNMVY